MGTVNQTASVDPPRGCDARSWASRRQIRYDGRVTVPLPPVRVPHPHVIIDQHGSPVVEGSRIPVRRLYQWHRDRIAVATMLKRYPQLGPARLFDALAFAFDNLDLIVADLEREREALEGHDRDGEATAQGGSQPPLPLTPASKKRDQGPDTAQLALPFKRSE